MNWLVLLPGVAVPALLVVLGYAIKYRKAYWLISGYNMMAEEKKKNVDAEGLGRFLGNCLFALAGLIAVVFALMAFNQVYPALAALALLAPGIIFMVVRAQRFDGNARREGRMTAQTKITIAMLAVVLGGAAVGVGFLIRGGAKPAEFIVAGGALEIKCMFGETVQVKDAAGLELARARPGIARRTFGSAVGETLRGSFALADGSAAKVYIENATPPFIHFAVGRTQYYINCSTPEETEKLFAQLAEPQQK